MTRRIFLTMVVISCLFYAGCPWSNALKSIDKMQDLVDELRLHNTSIAEITNKYHPSVLSDELHADIIDAADIVSKRLNDADGLLKTARSVQSKTEGKGVLDSIQRLLDNEVWTAFFDMTGSIINVPPEVRGEFDRIMSLVRIAFSAIRALFAEAHLALKPERYAYAD